ncbi:MAG: branched-chain amino acid ABC transporter permease [Proteobacteria bacterium]|nr:branched-chain amino acid ABC transporter permease [Pseudomonadota bacterium]
MRALTTYPRRAYTIFRTEVLVLPSRIVVLLFAVALLVIPLFTQDPYWLRVLIQSSIFAIFAASWDLLSGFTGQMNFGHALFFGVSAYVTAMINLYLHLPPVFSIPLGALAGVMCGLIVGIPCLRLRGAYLALTTLAFPIILLGIVFAIPGITGGELGLTSDILTGGMRRMARLSPNRVTDYYVCVLAMLVLGGVMWKITDSRVGIIFHAIREDELAVRASGVNTVRYKLMAFCLSGFFAGIAGGLFAHFLRQAGPDNLMVTRSFEVIIWSVFGGIASIYGPIAGVFILYPLLEFFRVLPQIRMLLFAAMVLAILLFMPEGLIPWVRDKIEKICPRCKNRNVATRKTCRVCTADLD